MLNEFEATQPYEKLSEDSELNWRGQSVPEHHLPKIVADSWRFPVELHMLVVARRVSGLLPAADVIEQRLSTSVGGMSIPGPEDRACHLIAHATRHGSAVSLRAWIDWAQLARLCDKAMVRDRLSRFGFEEDFNEFEVLAAQLEGIGPTGEVNRAVLRNALMKIGNTHTKQNKGLLNPMIRRLQTLFISAKYRSHIASEMQDLQWRAQILAILRRRN